MTWPITDFKLCEGALCRAKSNSKSHSTTVPTATECLLLKEFSKSSKCKKPNIAWGQKKRKLLKKRLKKLPDLQLTSISISLEKMMNFFNVMELKKLPQASTRK